MASSTAVAYALFCNTLFLAGVVREMNSDETKGVKVLLFSLSRQVIHENHERQNPFSVVGWDVRRVHRSSF